MKKLLLPFLCLLVLISCNSVPETKIIPVESPARPAGQTDVLQLRCDPIPVVRVAFIGTGSRGRGAVRRFLSIPGVEIKALCDLETNNLERARRLLAEQNFPAAQEYSGENGYKEVCERDDIDLVYICTDWLSHTPIAVYGMEHGKHVAIEVPAATTLDECWQLVNTAERTRKHCMMLENCCYDRFEMATLNMAQQGVFGEIVHVEGAYIHDLRGVNLNDRMTENDKYVPSTNRVNSEGDLTNYWKKWRMAFNIQHTGNPYPTHGLGPVCQVLNIHRGDRMTHLVSLSSDQFGITEFNEVRYGKDSPETKQHYELGDMNTTVIRTQKGKTIMIQHDVTSPRPYSRIHLVSGTKGFAQKYPFTHIALEPNAHAPLPAAQLDSVLNVYEHPFYKEIGERARSLGSVSHGGMDFIMDSRLVYCLQNGLPLDQDVYDAAEWSCLVPLTELSVRNDGAPVAIPDFTRGAWDKLKGLKFAE